jgi:hypothetical protein
MKQAKLVLENLGLIRFATLLECDSLEHRYFSMELIRVGGVTVIDETDP